MSLSLYIYICIFHLSFYLSVSFSLSLSLSLYIYIYIYCQTSRRNLSLEAGGLPAALEVGRGALLASHVCFQHRLHPVYLFISIYIYMYMYPLSRVTHKRTRKDSQHFTENKPPKGSKPKGSRYLSLEARSLPAALELSRGALFASNVGFQHGFHPVCRHRLRAGASGFRFSGLMMRGAAGGGSAFRGTAPSPGGRGS